LSVPSETATDPATSAASEPEKRRVLRPTSQGSFRAVLGNLPFLRLWLAQAVSQTANSMVDFSLLLVVGAVVSLHEVAQANTAVSFVILAFSLPSVIFGPIAGAVADRINRRNLMAIVNVVRVVLVGLFLIVQPTWPVQAALGAYYAIAFLFGAAGQFFAPAQGASIPSLVPREQLTAANALFNLTFTATQLLGFAILGPLLSQVFGVNRLFMATIVAFALSAVLTMTLPSLPLPSRVIRDEKVHPFRQVWVDVREGLVFIGQDRILIKAIAYLTLATTTFMLIAALAPNFVATVVGLPPSDIGYLVAPGGLGVIGGVILVPRLVRRFQRDAVVDWAIAIGGVCLLLIALSRVILMTLMTPRPVPLMLEVSIVGGLAAVLGICNALVIVPSQTILQERSHEHIRARVYATFFTISSFVSFVPIFFAAALADLVGVVRVLAGVAILLIAAGAISLLRALRNDRQRYERVRTRHRQGPEAVPPGG
jgi:MFS family permease